MSEARPYCPNRPVAAKRRVQLVLFGLVLVLLGALARPMLAWLRWILNDPVQDMSHGWLVPFFSLYLVWRRRREIAAAVATGAPSLAGVLLCLPLLLMLWMGERGDQPRLSQVAVYGLLWTLPYACFGRRMARLLFFPVVFLFFMVPLGFLDFFTVRLRMATAWISAFLLNGVGIPVRRVGTGLHFLSGGGFALDVADPCSGLRAIFAIATLTAAYAYMTLSERWKQWLLFACAVPLAVLGNMARILAIALVAHFFGSGTADVLIHKGLGNSILPMLVAVPLMFQCGVWIDRIGTRGTKKNKKEAPPAAVGTPDVAGASEVAAASDVAGAPATAAVAASGSWAAWAGLVLLPLAMAGMLTALRRLPPPVLEPQNFLAASLPELPGYRLAKPWHCHNEQCRKVFDNIKVDPATGKPPPCPICGGTLDEVSYGERAYLPDDTLFMKGNYYDALGGRLHVSVVVNGASRRSIHRAELCLPAQGFSIENISSRELPDGTGGRLRVKLLDLRPSLAGEQQRASQVYYFVSAHHQTASNLVRLLITMRDRALFNRVTRWAMVAVVGEPPFDTPERLRTLQKFLDKFNPALRSPGAHTAGVPGRELAR